MTRHRAGVRRELVPAVPEPLDRHDRLRRRRRALRERRRRRELQLRRLRAEGLPAEEPLRRSARRRRATLRRRRPPKAARSAVRTSARAAIRSRLRRHRAPPRSAHRRTPMPDNPLVGGAEPRRRPDHRLRPPQSVPHDAAPRHERDLGRRRRLERLGGDRPHRATPATCSIENFGWPCYEGIGAQPRLSEAPGSTSATVSTTRRDRHRPVLHVQSRRPGRARRGRAAPAARRSPASPSTAPAATRRRYDGALFFADYSRELHLGDAARPGRRARPERAPHLRERAPRRPSISRSARAATSSTSTSTAAPSTASATSPAPSRRSR